MVGRIFSVKNVFSQKLKLGVLLLVHKRFPNRTLFKNIFTGNTILSIPPSYARSINSRSTLCHHIIAYVLIRYKKNIRDVNESHNLSDSDQSMCVLARLENSTGEKFFCCKFMISLLQVNGFNLVVLSF